MKLSQVASQMARKDSVNYVWNQWAYDTYVVNYDDSEHNDGRYHPSMLFRCPAYIFLYMEQFPIPNAWKPEVQRIFGNGDAVHERIQVDLCRAGILDVSQFDESQETPISIPRYNIGGHADGVVNFGPKVDTGKTFLLFGKECPIYKFTDQSQGRVLEIKSMNTMQFSKLADAKDEHVNQASIYAEALSLDLIHFIYEDKNNQQWKEFIKKPNREVIEDVKQKVLLVESWRQEFRKTGRIPKGVVDAARKTASRKDLPPWEVKAKDLLIPRVGARQGINAWLRERAEYYANLEKPVKKKPTKKVKKKRSLVR